MRILVVAIALVLVGCGGSRATPVPTRAPTPEPTPAWRLSADATYRSAASVGDDVDVEFTIENAGAGRNPGTKITVDGVDNLDLIGCIPECEYSDFLQKSMTLPGVPGGESATFTIRFLAVSVGVADIFMCVYDEPQFGEQVWCGSGSIVVR